MIREYTKIVTVEAVKFTGDNMDEIAKFVYPFKVTSLNLSIPALKIISPHSENNLVLEG